MTQCVQYLTDEGSVVTATPDIILEIPRAICEQTQNGVAEDEEISQAQDYSDSPPSLENIVNVMSHDSSSSTPVLVSSPQGTPMNTPVEGDATDEMMSPGLNSPSGLVRNIMLEAANRAALTPLDDSTENSLLLDKNDIGKVIWRSNKGHLFTESCTISAP